MIIKIEFKVEFESSSSYSSTEKRLLKEIEKKSLSTFLMTSIVMILMF